MVEFSKPFSDVFRKFGVSRWGIFQLSNNENVMEFTNIAKTVSANLDEMKSGQRYFTTTTKNIKTKSWKK